MSMDQFRIDALGAHIARNATVTTVTAPMGTNGEAIPLPPLLEIVADDIEIYAESYDRMEQMNGGGTKVSCTCVAVDLRQNIIPQVQKRFAPYAERIRHLERELEDTKANLHTAVQQAWTANASLSQAKRELDALIDECREAVQWWEPLRPFIDKHDAAALNGKEEAK